MSVDLSGDQLSRVIQVDFKLINLISSRDDILNSLDDFFNRHKLENEFDYFFASCLIDYIYEEVKLSEENEIINKEIIINHLEEIAIKHNIEVSF